PGRCDGWADARQLLLGPSAEPRHSPLQRGWPAGCCPMSTMAGTGLGTEIETELREASPLLRTGDSSGPPLAHACDGKGAVDDVQDRARFGWGAVDHPADRVREVRAPPGDRAPTGDLRSPRRPGPGGSHRSRRQCHPFPDGARAAGYRAAPLPGLRPRMDLA